MTVGTVFLILTDEALEIFSQDGNPSIELRTPFHAELLRLQKIFITGMLFRVHHYTAVIRS